MNAPQPKLKAWPVKAGTPPFWKHQTDALARSRSLAAFAFDYDPGLGKTATVIAEAGAMFLAGEIDTLIVVAPNRVHRQWIVKQFPVWAGYPWRGFPWPKGGLSSQKRKDEFEKWFKLSSVHPALRVFAINIENVRQAPGTRGKPAGVTETVALLRRIVQSSKDGVYVAYDESQRIKDPRSQQTIAAHRYLSRAAGIKVRRKLSGSPILQGVQDLWAQYAFLDPLIIGEPTFWSFRSRYCKLAPVPGRPNAARIVGARNLDDLMKRIAPFTARVTKDDADLGLPDAMPPDRFSVEMEPAQAKAYAQMDSLMMAGLKSGTGDGGKIITATIVLTQLQKLLQIASGFIHDENGSPHWISDSKVEAILEKADELGGEHLVVWAPFIPLLERLEAAFGSKGTRFRELSDVDVWNKKGGVLIANPASGGVGVDGMQLHCHRAYYAANTFHLEHRIQSLERIHRGGQIHTCFWTDFVTEGTKDEFVLDVLAAKRDFGGLTVDKLRALLLNPTLPLL